MGFVNVTFGRAARCQITGVRIVEQLGWKCPAARRVSGCRRDAAAPLFGASRLRTIGLVEGELPRVHAAQAAGLRAGRPRAERDWIIQANCGPIRSRNRLRWKRRRIARVIECVRETRGSRSAVSDAQIIHAIELLAESEDLTEPAGGTTAATVDLISGAIPWTIDRDLYRQRYKTAEVGSPYCACAAQSLVQGIRGLAGIEAGVGVRSPEGGHYMQILLTVRLKADTTNDLRRFMRSVRLWRRGPRCAAVVGRYETGWRP